MSITIIHIMDHLKLDIDTVVDLFIDHPPLSMSITMIHIMDDL